MRWFNKLCVPIIILIVFVSAKNIQLGGDNWKGIIKADGKGYYAYLPAIFIYNDLSFSFFDSIEEKYPNPSTYYDYRAVCYGKTCNKYFAGTALAVSPFFLMAHFTTSSDERDGYSKNYLIMVSIAAILYLWLGLFFLKKLLTCYTQNETLVSICLILVVFSTNLFYYAVNEPSMSHIYSFTFISIFLFYAKKYFQQPNFKYLLLLSFLLGIIILIRPVNILVLLALPFIADKWEIFKNGLNYLFKRYVMLFISFLIVGLVVGMQFFIYKIQTGHFFIDTYGEEAFNWLSPHPIDFLLSYKKGLFVYTPILFLSLLGLIVLFKKNRYKFYSVVLFLIVLIYALSSWWNWWYGGSLGTRVMIEYYSIFVLLLLIAVENSKKGVMRIIFYSMLFCTLVISQIQTYQYRYYHIHWEKMDKEHFWKSFLRIDLISKNINPNKDLLNE